MAPSPTPGASPAFNPMGKTFPQRLDAFIADVQSKYSVTIRKDSGRTAEWEQKLHIVHMFLYNKYQSTIPANVDPGKRTISWGHLSDPKVVWNTAQWSDILRTSKGTVPIRAGNSWKQGFEPDRTATEKQAKSLLTAACIGDNGEKCQMASRVDDGTIVILVRGIHVELILKFGESPIGDLRGREIGHQKREFVFANPVTRQLRFGAA